MFLVRCARSGLLLRIAESTSHQARRPLGSKVGNGFTGKLPMKSLAVAKQYDIQVHMESLHLAATKTKAPGID